MRWTDNDSSHIGSQAMVDIIGAPRAETTTRQKKKKKFVVLITTLPPPPKSEAALESLARACREQSYSLSAGQGLFPAWLPELLSSHHPISGALSKCSKVSWHLQLCLCQPGGTCRPTLVCLCKILAMPRTASYLCSHVWPHLLFW